MANQLGVINMITKEALYLLKNNLVFAAGINRKYSNEFSGNGAGKIGSTIRIRKPSRYTVTSGSNITGKIQDIKDDYVLMSINQLDNIAVEIPTDWEKFNLNSYKDQFLDSAIATLANHVDAVAFKKCALATYNTVGNPTTSLNNSNYVLAAKSLLDTFGTPSDKRKIVVGPSAQAGLIASMTGLYHPGNSVSSQFKKGVIADDVFGFTIAMSQNTFNHTVGSGASDPIKVNGASQEGSTLVIKDMVGKLNAGDVFTIDGVYSVNYMSKESTGMLQQFVVTETTTDAATSLKISPAIDLDPATKNVTGSPANNAEITVVGAANSSYSVALAYHKDAFTFACIDLPTIDGAINSRVASAEAGISIRLVKQGDIMTNSNVSRMDVLWDVMAVRPELATRIISTVAGYTP